MQFHFANSKYLGPDGWVFDALGVHDGCICTDISGRKVDAHGYLILPGIIDLHGDGYIYNIAARRGALKDMTSGFWATEAELAANGITTSVIAQFYSWEGGMNSPEYAERVFNTLAIVAPQMNTTLLSQLRFEYNMLDQYDQVIEIIDKYKIPYVVFNDHLPHAALAKGKRPPRLNGQALKAGRNPEKQYELILSLYENSHKAWRELPKLAKRLHERGVVLGGHDTNSSERAKYWHDLGVNVAEFPETFEAAQTHRQLGGHIIMGAPNVMRGNSHKGNVCATQLIEADLVDALASDYLYNSPRAACISLADKFGWQRAWRLVSSGPAALLGLSDRGELAPNKRADIVIIDEATGRIAGTFANGVPTYLTGDFALRLMQ